MRFSSHSLGVFDAIKSIYRPGHQPLVSASHPLVQISYVEPDRVFTRVTQTGDVVMASPARMRRPSTSGPASVVDSTVRGYRTICVVTMTLVHFSEIL
jgi:hypothetical protein